MRFSSAALAGLLWLFAQPAAALDPNFLPTQYLLDVFGKEEGLPSDTVWVSTEGPRGYLWVGTRGGLVRFDGRNMSVFNRENTDAFRANEVRELAWTHDNELWIGTYGGGITVMNGGEFSTITTEDGLASDVVFDIMMATDGAIWVATDKGVTRVKKGEFKSWAAEDGLPSDHIFRIVEDDDGTVWFGSLIAGLAYFDGEDVHTIEQNQLASSEIHLLTKDPVLGVVAGTLGGSLYGLGSNGHVTPIELSQTLTIENSLVDRDGNRWLGTYGDGLWRLKPDGSQSKIPLTTAGDTIHVFDMVEDSYGSLWVSTPQGLYRLRDGPFRTFGTIEGAENSSFSVAADTSGTIWAGTEAGGAFTVDSATGDVQQLAEFVDRNVSSLLPLRNGEMWLGTFGDGIFRLNASRELIGTVEGLSGAHIIAMTEMRDGSVWIAHNRGVERWMAGAVQPALNNFKLPLVRHINEARSGTVWLSSNDGLYEVGSRPTRRWGKEQGLPGAVITSTYEDARGVLWITFRNGGLARLVGDQVFSFGPEHGISTLSSFAILEDSSRNLWISGSGGLLSAPRDELDSVALGELPYVHTTVYDERRGLRSSQFLGGFQPAAWKAPDNQLWYVSTRGLTGFDPRDLVIDTPPLHTYIEAVRVDGESIPMADPIQLPASFSTLEIDYAAPALRDAYLLNYRFKLGNGEAGWQEVGDRSTAYFNAIPAGASEFKVQASVGDGGFPDADHTTAGITIIRAPRWYETTWSVLVAVAFIILLMSVVQRFMSRRARARELELKQLVDRRTFELREALAQVEANARVDTLTGIPNRKHMEEQLAAVWNMARRSRVPVSILMLDIDRFKEYNDTLGHNAGDECLRKIARAISDKLLREHDMVARYGGEEFLVVLYDSDTTGARGAAKRILECVQALQLPHPASDVSGFVSVSVGYATATIEQANRPKELIDLADRALYDAKRAGRNRIAAAPGSAPIAEMVDIAEASNEAL
ncbi:MAG: diguanylate cyclase [Pseudomonadota bacterium]